MHVEALTYMRQTSSNAAAAGLGARRVPRAGALPGDVAVPGGALAARLDGRRWLRLRQREVGARGRARTVPHRARAPVTNAEFAAFVEDGGYRTRAFWSDAGWAWRERRAMPSARSTGRTSATASWTERRYRTVEELAPHARRRCS